MINSPSVLIIIPYYLPGYKSGGPTRSISSIVDSCGNDFSFSIITRDRDSGDKKPYESVNVNSINRVGKAKVLYANDKLLTISGLYRSMSKLKSDVIYLNSFFDPVFTLVPLVLNALFFNKFVVLCPRGEFSPGALSIKALKKKFYIRTFKFFGLHNKIIWQATTKEEAGFIRCIFGDEVRVKLAMNISLPSIVTKPFSPKSRVLKVSFLSRVSHKKNVLGALKALSKVSSRVSFDIYGPSSRPEDKSYLRECQAYAKSLPDNIDVKFKGEICHESVGETLEDYDLFFLPTLGENFGHAILEALAAGLPLLISNTTPWNDLEDKGVGWEAEPTDTVRFAECIEKLASMSDDQHIKMRLASLQYAKDYLASSEAVAQTKTMFTEVTKT